MKHCIICKRKKDKVLFHKDRSRSDGRKEKCADCCNQYGERYYKQSTWSSNNSRQALNKLESTRKEKLRKIGKIKIQRIIKQRNKKETFDVIKNQNWITGGDN
jgi:hypothetical protein